MKHMKQGSTLFLKVALLLIGLVVLSALLGMPWLEGRNANADFMKVYFQDPFLTYVYIAMTPFFVALYQAYKLLGIIEKNNVFSQIAVDCLRNIKRCAFAVATLASFTLPYLFAFGQEDDAPGVVLLGLIAIFATLVIAVAAGVFQRMLQAAVDIKSENDLTV